jgi:hypothetical protein
MQSDEAGGVPAGIGREAFGMLRCGSSAAPAREAGALKTARVAVRKRGARCAKRWRWRAAVVIGMAAVSVPGCAPNETLHRERPPVNQIRAEVLAGGQPLSGVTVALAGTESRTETTGPNGIAAFDGLPAGSFTVTISGFDQSRWRFVRTSTPVTLGAPIGQVTVQFRGDPLPTGAITGRVTVGGRPLSQLQGESISLTLVPPEGDEVTRTLAGSDGTFAFTGLREGEFTLRLAYRGQTRALTVTLARGERRILSLDLLLPGGERRSADDSGVPR